MPFPNIDPIAFSIGNFHIRWYALAYMAGLFLGRAYMIRLVARDALWRDKSPAAPNDIDDFFLWVTLGVILGGRLGYVLFYNPAYFAANPSAILAVWSGGMSYHGGMLGVGVASLAFGLRRKISPLTLLDMVCAAVPIGLFFGRVSNFINSELWGRVTTHPLGVVFPNGGPLPRHPSQLYEAVLEGILLFIVARVLIFSYRALHRPGMVMGAFLVGYGLSRIVVETVREPDAHIGYIGGAVTMGMVLSVPMVLGGAGLIYYAIKTYPLQAR